MKKAIILLTLLITLAVAITSCTEQKTEISTITSTTTITITTFTSPSANTGPEIYSDPSQTINVSVNEEFVLALESNPTTGYSWQETHDAGLNLISNDYQQKEAPEGMVGVGGTEYFRFQAVQKGEAKVTLTYRRPWESPTPTDKTEVFTVNVN